MLTFFWQSAKDRKRVFVFTSDMEIKEGEMRQKCVERERMWFEKIAPEWMTER